VIYKDLQCQISSNHHQQAGLSLVSGGESRVHTVQSQVEYSQRRRTASIHRCAWDNGNGKHAGIPREWEYKCAQNGNGNRKSIHEIMGVEITTFPITGCKPASSLRQRAANDLSQPFKLQTGSQPVLGSFRRVQRARLNSTQPVLKMFRTQYATDKTRSLAIAKRPCNCFIILKSGSYTKAI